MQIDEWSKINWEVRLGARTKPEAFHVVCKLAEMKLNGQLAWEEAITWARGMDDPHSKHK